MEPVNDMEKITGHRNCIKCQSGYTGPHDEQTTKNVTLHITNDMYEKQLDARMNKLLNRYMDKFKDMPLSRKEELVTDVAERLSRL